MDVKQIAICVEKIQFNLTSTEIKHFCAHP